MKLGGEVLLKDFLEDYSAKNKIKKDLYAFIQKNPLTSKVDFLKELNVPQTTLTRMINELEEKRLIRVGGHGESNGGRPPVLYEVVPQMGFVVGIEISRTHVNLSLLNVKLELIDQTRFIMTRAHTPELTLNQVKRSLSKLLELHNINESLLLGIGIGAVGPINREEGIILNPEGFLAGGWQDVPIKKIIQDTFPVPVILNNGANTAALAEYEDQVHKESILYCISGYGVRFSYLNQGEFLNLKEGDTSSYGHIIIEPNGRQCVCGKKGCLNAYVTFDSILNRIKEINKDNNLATSTIDDLLDNLDHDDIQSELLESAYYYGIAIANMINILHPRTVVLQGKLIYHSESYFNKVIDVAKTHLHSQSAENTVIKKSHLGKGTVSIGAAIQLFRNLLN